MKLKPLQERRDFAHWASRQTPRAPRWFRYLLGAALLTAALAALGVALLAIG